MCGVESLASDTIQRKQEGEGPVATAVGLVYACSCMAKNKGVFAHVCVSLHPVLFLFKRQNSEKLKGEMETQKWERL